eukprot:1178685-Prorocentrum_minimum.AAC.8
MQAFSNNAGLELLAMLQHAPPTARPQPSQQLPQHIPRHAAPPKPAQPTATAMPAVFPAPSEPSAGEDSASLHLMSLLGISAAGAPPAQQQQPQPQRVQQEDIEEEQIVFGGFFASKQASKPQAAARPPMAPTPEKKKKDEVAPSAALFKSRGQQRPSIDLDASAVKKANNPRGPMVRLAKGPDGTIGFHAGRMAAGLPVIYIDTPSTRSTSPPSPRKSTDAAQEGIRGASVKKNNKKNDTFHRGPQHHQAGFQQHRSPLKACGNTERDGGNHWRPSQPVFV